MKIIRIPADLRTIIFDIDSTLYTNPAYAFEQVDVQIRYFAKLRGISADEARHLIGDYRQKWADEHGGKRTSLGNTLTAFGIPIEESVRWREMLVEPGKFLRRDDTLAAVLDKLRARYRLICVTNNPVLPARKTLDAIGISEQIPDIIGLDTCNKSKPAREPFLLAAERTGVLPENCLSVGDRYDIDIALPLELGMGGIVVTGVKEVYTLPEILK